jgi:type II secretory pathway component PulF
MSRGPGEPRRPKRPGGPDAPGDDETAPGPSTFRPTPAGRRVEPRARRPADPDAGGNPVPPDAGATRRGPSARRTAPETSAKPRGLAAAGEMLIIGRVGAGDLAKFCRLFGVYLNSGVGIAKALESLRQQMAGTALGPVAERLQQAVQRGETISDACAREPQAFDALFLSMVRVAEARGGLPETLKDLAAHYESRQRLFRQARTALIYPTAVILIAIAVGALLTMFVLPTLVSILRDMTRGKGVDLPWPTRVLMGFSVFVQAVGWWLIPLGLVVGAFALLRAYRTPRGKRALDEVIVRVPVMGKLVGLIDQARYARTLGDLLDAGVDYDRSLALTADVVQFGPYRAAVEQVREDVRAGSEVSPAMARTSRFAPDLLAFVETGEETGQLPESLQRVARDYEDRVEHMVKNIGSLIQPLIVIVLGAIIGFIALAFIMAYVAVLMSLMSGF